MPELKEQQPLILIRPKKGLQLMDLKELSHYRDLLFFLVARNIKIKYKQTVLGGLWAVIQPFFMMVVFTLFFGRLAKMPSDGIPYPIFNYSAMIAWVYFAQAVGQSGNSIVGEQNLISKVYFPRIVIPLTPIISGLLDFFIAFLVLLGMMLYYRIWPTMMVFILPLLIMLMMLTAIGVGTILSALNAKYRDIGYTIPFLLQFWMFASPIVYPSSLVPERYRMIYAINPMVGVIEGFRSALLGNTVFPAPMVVLSAAVSLGLFMAGIVYFKQVERHFADVI